MRVAHDPERPDEDVVVSRVVAPTPAPDDERPAAVAHAGADVVSGVYEGGLKVWEGSVDLLRYVAATRPAARRVLELGCGHGLCGIGALLACPGVGEVVFQDLNTEALELATWPNVALNTADHDPPPSCRYFAGTWEALAEQLAEAGETFDLILAAECTYTAEAAAAVAATVAALLADGGTALVCGKRYYFGTGGGSDAFTFAAASLGLDVVRGAARAASSGPRYACSFFLTRSFVCFRRRPTWKTTGRTTSGTCCPCGGRRREASRAGPARRATWRRWRWRWAGRAASSTSDDDAGE